MLSGSIVALATPFCEDGSVNFERLGEWIEFQIENGTDGILVLGTTGESSTMSHEEDDAVCAYAVEKVAGRAKVIAGSGSNSTETQLMKSKTYAGMGCCASLPIIIRPMKKECTVISPRWRTPWISRSFFITFPDARAVPSLLP